jgi:hypothetical protein
MASNAPDRADGKGKSAPPAEEEVLKMMNEGDDLNAGSEEEVARLMEVEMLRALDAMEEQNGGAD